MAEHFRNGDCRALVILIDNISPFMHAQWPRVMREQRDAVAAEIRRHSRTAGFLVAAYNRICLANARATERQHLAA